MVLNSSIVYVTANLCKYGPNTVKADGTFLLRSQELDLDLDRWTYSYCILTVQLLYHYLYYQYCDTYSVPGQIRGVNIYIVPQCKYI